MKKRLLKKNVERVLVAMEIIIPILIASATSEVSILVLLGLVGVEYLITKILIKYSRLVNED